MGKRFDIVSSGGEYQKNGETKVRWINHGAIFEKDGKWSMKLDSYPVGGEGWFNLFEPRNTKASSKVNKGREVYDHTGPAAQGYGGNDFDDDIPF